MKAAQISQAGAAFEIVERKVPKPGAGEVLVRIEACGICHSDAVVKEGAFPGITYPRVPGHEVAGVVESVGYGVKAFKAGDRVGAGWHGGHCFTCDTCRTGDFNLCANQTINGVLRDGGFAEQGIFRAEALAHIPEELDATMAAPLMCAGITTYNALRNCPARPGDVVAVQGIGGLGHLGVQFASRMGYRTVALSRGEGKQSLAMKLGATDYIDTAETDPAAALRDLGGARVILATAPNADAVASIIPGLSANGVLVLAAAFGEPFAVNALDLIMGKRSIIGWNSGHAKDSEDTLRFSALTGVRPMIETFPLADVNAAYERMITNNARFRVVLTMT